MMKKIFSTNFHIILFLLLLCPLTKTISAASINKNKIEYIKGGSGCRSSFAIFVDAKSFAECRNEIMEYKTTLDKEGLSTIIISSNFASPESIKKEIAKLASSKIPLEGMTFVGDIPIVRIRKGQHMTTAFKMNEKKFPMTESSVTSDRFYDTPSLKFSYIGKDSINERFFYYNLLGESAQILRPEYYSSRILVPEKLVQDSGKSKYEWLKIFFKKAVNAHRNRDSLNHIIYFSGHGYNSDCLTAWIDQPVAFRTSFPDAFKTSSGNKFLNFRQNPEMKFILFNEMQRKETDVFLFYEHGAPDTQYINGDYPSYSLQTSIEQLKRTLRNTYRKTPENKKNAFVNEVCSHFGLSPKMFEKEQLDKFKTRDSADNANKDIHLEDLQKLKMGSKVTIFNACYNGSFHQPGYVAGYHIFNDGNTIVAQGNTVNVLQDKWAEELIGMLSLGARIGFWQKEVVTLESHLIGDPTYKFYLSKEGKKAINTSDTIKFDDLNYLLINKKNDTVFWKKFLVNTHNTNKASTYAPIMRAIAIKQLLKNNGNHSDLFFNIFNNDTNMVVRMEAFRALMYYSDTTLYKVIAKALFDNYEMLRRDAANIAGKIGNPALSPLLKKVIDDGIESQRVMYAAKQSLDCLKEQKFDINSPNVIDKIRLSRNYPSNSLINNYLKSIADENVNTELRIAICEALGWYNYSWRRNEIIKNLQNVLQTASSDINPDLKDELIKTVNRLKR